MHVRTYAWLPHVLMYSGVQRPLLMKPPPHLSFSSSSSMRLPAQDRERVVRSHPHVRGVHALTHCEDPETWDPRTVE